MHDATTAEAYCIRGGAISGETFVPLRVAQSLAGNDPSLDGCVKAFFSPGGGKGAAARAGNAVSEKQKSGGVNEGLKRELLNMLLEVYMLDDG